MYINTKLIQIIIKIGKGSEKYKRMTQYCVGGILIHEIALLGMAYECQITENHDGQVLKVRFIALDNKCYESLLS